MSHTDNFSAINVLTPVGNLYLESSPSGLRRCAFVGGSNALSPVDLFSAQPDNPLLTEALIQLCEYFQGTLRSFSLPLNLSGLPPFQTRVLLTCAAIPWGQVFTYAQLAAAVGSPGASRAVGSSLARNPLPLFIPCHRVIGSDRALHGFAAPDGIRTKAWLLRHEGVRLENGKLKPQTGGNS